MKRHWCSNTDDSLETSGRLWQYYRDEPPLTSVSAIYNVLDDSASFKSNQQLIQKLAVEKMLK